MNTIGSLNRLYSTDPDLRKVIQLDQLQFPRPWSDKDWEATNWDHHVLYSWTVGSQLKAFCFFSFVPGDDSVHLLKICVEDKSRGSGLAQMFWKSCIENLKSQGAKSVYLEVESPNVSAIKFYQKSGFKPLRTIKRYYSDGTDAITMEMTI